MIPPERDNNSTLTKYYTMLDFYGTSLQLAYSKELGGSPIVRTATSINQPCLDPEKISITTRDLSIGETIAMNQEMGMFAPNLDIDYCSFEIIE